MKVALPALMNASGCATVSVNVCVASLPTPLVAVNVIVALPPAVGVPMMAAVPSPLSVSDSPAGRLPALSVICGREKPAVVIVNVPACPVSSWAAGR